jgi:tetratricopeptide (TPR) repeat protein
MTTLLARVALGAGVAAALTFLGPAIAEAQPGPGTPPPTAAQMDAARKLVNDGIAAQNAKDYDKAIELYKKAYAIVPHPILMFNIGQAHRLAGRHDQAVPFYERYLALEPGGAEAPAARAALAEIKAAPKPAEPGKPAEPPKPPEPPKPAEPGARPAPPPSVSQGAPPPAAGPTTPSMPVPGPDGTNRTDTVGSPGRTLRLTGLVLGGVGLASAAAGIYFTTRVRHWESEAEDRAMMGATNDELEAEFGDKGRAAERNQFIGYAIGGALVVGGAVTYWLGLRKDQAASTTAWAPVVGPGFTGIAISGSLP